MPRQSRVVKLETSNYKPGVTLHKYSTDSNVTVGVMHCKGAAKLAGMKKGQQILSLNGIEVETSEHAIELLDAAHKHLLDVDCVVHRPRYCPLRLLF